MCADVCWLRVLVAWTVLSVGAVAHVAIVGWIVAMSWEVNTSPMLTRESAMAIVVAMVVQKPAPFVVMSPLIRPQPVSRNGEPIRCLVTRHWVLNLMR